MSTRVFVGNLSYRTSDRDLKNFFRSYGKIRDIWIKNGFAFVEFDDYRDADDAVYDMNGEVLLGESVTVEHARGPAWKRGGGRDRYDDRYGGRYGGGGGGYRGGGFRGRRGGPGPVTRSEHRLVVTNLPDRITWQDLKDHFKSHGDVVYADIKRLGRKTEGIVEFALAKDMRYVLDKLHKTEYDGHTIHLSEDKHSHSRSRSRDSRSRSRSGSRSRKRSRSRSRSGSRRRSRSSRSRSRSHRRSRSTSRDNKRSRTSSGSRKRKGASKDRGHSSSRSRSPSPRKRSASKSASKSRSRSRSKSNSKQQNNSHDADPARSRSRSPEPKKDNSTSSPPAVQEQKTSPEVDGKSPKDQVQENANANGKEDHAN